MCLVKHTRLAKPTGFIPINDWTATEQRHYMSDGYVHGYDSREALRLQDQATTLVELLHAGTAYPPGARVLEAGCGVAAQTVTLCRNSPMAAFAAVDISLASLTEARQRVAAAGLTNVRFAQADLFNLPFAHQSFDHVFVCFVLEHLARPLEAIQMLGTVLRPGGSITVIEGDHGSAFFHPDSEAARNAIQCQVALQQRAGGNAMLGRQLHPLLCRAGYRDVRVQPRMVYVDGSKPALADGFTRKTFTAMIAGVRQAALQAGMLSAERFDQGIADLHKTAAPEGVFCYTFFKAVGVKGVNNGHRRNQT